MPVLRDTIQLRHDCRSQVMSRFAVVGWSIALSRFSQSYSSGSYLLRLYEQQCATGTILDGRGGSLFAPTLTVDDSDEIRPATVRRGADERTSRTSLQ